MYCIIYIHSLNIFEKSLSLFHKISSITSRRNGSRSRRRGGAGEVGGVEADAFGIDTHVEEDSKEIEPSEEPSMTMSLLSNRSGGRSGRGRSTYLENYQRAENHQDGRDHAAAHESKSSSSNDFNGDEITSLKTKISTLKQNLSNFFAENMPQYTPTEVKQILHMIPIPRPDDSLFPSTSRFSRSRSRTRTKTANRSNTTTTTSNESSDNSSNNSSEDNHSIPKSLSSSPTTSPPSIDDVEYLKAQVSTLENIYLTFSFYTNPDETLSPSISSNNQHRRVLNTQRDPSILNIDWLRRMFKIHHDDSHPSHFTCASKVKRELMSWCQSIWSCFACCCPRRKRLFRARMHDPLNDRFSQTQLTRLFAIKTALILFAYSKVFKGINTMEEGFTLSMDARNESNELRSNAQNSAVNDGISAVQLIECRIRASQSIVNSLVLGYFDSLRAQIKAARRYMRHKPTRGDRSQSQLPADQLNNIIYEYDYEIIPCILDKSGIVFGSDYDFEYEYD